MKLKDFIIEKKTKGLYVGVKLSDDTVKRIVAYCKKAKIPNVLDPKEFHSTLAYSRKPVNDFVPNEKIKEKGIPNKFEVWPSDPNAFKEDKTYCLVLKYDSDYMQNRFDEIMKMGATYDYDEYRPHVTLSYDVGKDFDIKKLPSLSNMKTFYITGEYSEPLDL